MLTLLGNKYRLCDRIPRRAFLQIGGLGLCGLTLADLLRADEKRSNRSRQKSVIMIFLPGGPSHIDTFDMKPHAPAEIRGEFAPIATNVPGIDVCELYPHVARTMDKLVLIRSLTGTPDDHASDICLTGHPRLGPQPSGGWPSFGSVVSKLLGPHDKSVPPSIDLADNMLHGPYNDPGPGFLGVGHAAFRPDGQSQENLVINGVDRNRLAKRRELLARFDRLRRDLETSGMMAGMDAFRQRAFDVITSPKVRNAMDLRHEDPRVVRQYGPGDPSLEPEFNAAPKMTEDLLVARRLVEAGARCVTVAFGAWDWHWTVAQGVRQESPLLDRGVAALVNDLHNRGLDRDVMVVVWGEFGRSPRINKAAGRDHWPAASWALLAGGGFTPGQVIGSTNRLGETVQDRPVQYRDVLATIYRHLGIDLNQTVTDFAGRPQYLVEEHQPIQELFS